MSGAFDVQRRPATKSTVLVIRVDDLSNTLDRILEHGGKVIRAPSRIGEGAPGYDAYFLDPSGNEMGLDSERSE